MTEPTGLLSIQDLRTMMQLLDQVVRQFEQKLAEDEDYQAYKSSSGDAREQATKKLKARLDQSKQTDSDFLPHEDINFYENFSRIKKAIAVLGH